MAGAILFWSVLGAIVQIFLHAASRGFLSGGLPVRAFFTGLFQIVFAAVFALFLFGCLDQKQAPLAPPWWFVLAFFTGLLSGHVGEAIRRLAEPAARFQPQPDLKPPDSDAGDEAYGLLPYTTLVIQLELDDAGLFDEDREIVRRHGFDDVSVSVQKPGESRIIPAMKVGKADSPFFIIDDVAQGKYILRAVQRVANHHNKLPLHLFSEQEIFVREEQQVVQLRLQKLNA